MSTVMDLSNALAGAVASAARSVLAVRGRPRLPSTGVHWRPGLVVTASHTVESERDVMLTTPDGRELSAQVAGRDPGLDIAVLRAEVGAVPVAELAPDGDLRVGHLVLALGTGLTIAAYTVCDGIGVRVSDSPLGFTAWLFALELPVAPPGISNPRSARPRSRGQSTRWCDTAGFRAPISASAPSPSGCPRRCASASASSSRRR